MPETEKAVQMLKMVFGNNLPPNFFDAILAIMQFYSHSSTKSIQEREKQEIVTKTYFDFAYDAELIYAAFLQQYHIDLCKTDMHWWKFRALLAGLSDETHFVKVVQYRSMDISKIKDKEQKKFYLDMKRRHKLPDKRSEEEKERQLNSIMEKMF